MTFTPIVHALASGIVPPVRLTLPPAAVAVPPHVLVIPGDAATVIPDGRVSVNATPVSDRVLAAGSLRVNVRVVEPLIGITGAPKALAIVGGATTVRIAVAVFPSPPSFEFTALVTFVLRPAVVPVTLTENWHEVSPARVAPERLIMPLPAVAVIVPPPHEREITLGVATTTPAGKESVNPMPVKVPVMPPQTPQAELGLVK